MMGRGRGKGLPFSRIFLAVDGSKPSWDGVEVALSLVKATGSRVTIVHVMPPGKGTSGGSLPTEEEKSAEAIVSRVQDAFAREGVKARTDLVKYGRPHTAIVQLAKEGWCDLLVMGASGDEGRGVYSVGSTAMRVAEDFRSPVILVKKRRGFSKLSLVVEEGRGGSDIDLAIDLARNLGGSLNFLVVGMGVERGDSLLRWAMQRACDAGVSPSGAVIENELPAISDETDRLGTSTLLIRRRRNLISRIRGGDGSLRLAVDCHCSVLLL
jgi:universal stress protein A